MGFWVYIATRITWLCILEACVCLESVCVCVCARTHLHVALCSKVVDLIRTNLKREFDGREDMRQLTM